MHTNNSNSFFCSIFSLSKKVPYFNFLVPMLGLVLTNWKTFVYNGSMTDIPDLKKIIVPEVLPEPDLHPQVVVNAEPAEMSHDEMIKAGIDLATEKRIQEIAVWAEKKKIFNGTEPPTPKQLNKIYNKLKKGLPIVKAIKRVCSVPTWNKWKREFPEVAAMEEHAMAEAVDRLLDRKQELSEHSGTHMGEIARDKIQMDELQNRIDRIDRLTEVRNSKNSAFGGSVVPIQINFGFGKPK